MKSEEKIREAREHLTWMTERFKLADPVAEGQVEGVLEALAWVCDETYVVGGTLDAQLADILEKRRKLEAQSIQ